MKPPPHPPDPPIPGANQGIGYSCAKNLALSSPTHHIILAARHPTNGASALTTLLSTPTILSIPHTFSTLSTIQLDVTSSASITSRFPPPRHPSPQRRASAKTNRTGGARRPERLSGKPSTIGVHARQRNPFLPLLRKKPASATS
ncbi:MAG: hypothetical protein L6R40_000146 [Gallowayella cf. fulva]|nr:MAG: hypothetical protein L6R40_000146 [Xanthomendoza cf. fulva]